MARRSSNAKARSPADEDTYDYEPLITQGITMLKFGRGGTPHERLFRLSGDQRYLAWHAGWFCKKVGTSCSVDLEKVTRIMQGQNTFQFQRWSHIYGDASEKSFSIVYIDDDNRERTLDLIAPSPDLFKLWFGGLKALVKKLQEQRQNYSQDSLYLKNLWDRADRDHSGNLDSNEIVKLIASINVHMPTHQIKAMYNKFDVDQNGKLDFQEFIEFMSYLRKRCDLEAVWSSIVTGEQLPRPGEPLNIDMENFPSKDAIISIEKFIQFWEAQMGEKMQPAEAKSFIQYCNSGISESVGKRKKKSPASDPDSAVSGLGIGRAGAAAGGGVGAAVEDDDDPNNFLIGYSMFANVMINSRVALFDPARAQEYQDMTKPLPYYYMASSHNTYLEGDQLTSFSSVNRYVNDLLSGCRCVELDCWDGDNGVPIICHGGTLTGKILFRDVIKAIYEYGFVNSPYPIVLSIENHCGLEQQKTLARTMVAGLQELLALPTRNPDGNIPSPSELKRKVLIKGKRGDISNEDEDEEEDDLDDDEELRKYQFGSGGSSSSAAAAAGAHTAENNKTPAAAKKKEKAVKIHPDLAAITFLGTGKVKSFRPEVSSTIPSDMMCSYGELKVNKLVRSAKTVSEWIEHNKTHLSRVYPKGTRIDSSNYMPCAAWSAGNQLVALNYQTGDLPFHVNFGKFLENGKCGYVLKPDYMISAAHKNAVSPPIRLVINMISGAHLPKPGGVQKGEIVDPFVTIFVHGPHASDTYEVKTRSIENNGFNPVWNQCFSFDIKNPDMSYLTFHVSDDDVIKSDFICFSSLPVPCVKRGFRNIPMFNALGQKDQDFEFATLFVRVSIEPLLSSGVSAGNGSVSGNLGAGSNTI